MLNDSALWDLYHFFVENHRVGVVAILLNRNLHLLNSIEEATGSKQELGGDIMIVATNFHTMAATSAVPFWRALRNQLHNYDVLSQEASRQDVICSLTDPTTIVAALNLKDRTGSLRREAAKFHHNIALQVDQHGEGQQPNFLAMGLLVSNRHYDLPIFDQQRVALYLEGAAHLLHNDSTFIIDPLAAGITALAPYTFREIAALLFASHQPQRARCHYESAIKAIANYPSPIRRARALLVLAKQLKQHEQSDLMAIALQQAEKQALQVSHISVRTRLLFQAQDLADTSS